MPGGPQVPLVINNASVLGSFPAAVVAVADTPAESSHLPSGCCSEHVASPGCTAKCALGLLVMKLLKLCDVPDLSLFAGYGSVLIMFIEPAGVNWRCPAAAASGDGEACWREAGEGHGYGAGSNALTREAL
jgi:hypothetical protein